MGNFFHSKILFWLLVIMWTVSLAAVLILWLPINGLSDMFYQHLPITIQDVQPSGYGGYGYWISMGTERFSQNENYQSPAQLFEDGQPLGPGNAAHADIGTLGGGRFSLWKDGFLYFSASDNSDPRTNGRQYVLALPFIRFPLFWSLLIFACLCALLASLPAWRNRGSMNIKIDTIFKRSFLIIAGIWLVIGFSALTYKVLSKDYTFAVTDPPADGIGSIAEIGFLKSQPFLQNDNSKIIAPLMVVPTSNDDKWWIIKQYLALFFSPDNVYDYLVISFWLLNLLAGYYLFRTLKLNRFSAVVFGLTLAGLEVFSSRIDVHLTMAAIFILTMQIAYAFKLIESPSGKNIYIFAILCFAGFLSNEYYGYFGFIFSITLIIFHFVLNIKRVKEFKIKEIIYGLIIFCSGMGLVYANIFRVLVVHDAKTALIIHSYYDHVFYSVKNPLEIFYSGQYGLNFTLSNPWEFTFHLGLFILIFIFACFLYAVNRRIYLDNKLILATLFSGLILALFGLDPDLFLSLEKITYYIAPQFRVGARAYLWVDFAVIIIAAIVYRDIMRAQSVDKPRSTSFVTPLLSLSLVFILLDTSMGFYSKGPRLYPVPENRAYKYIAEYPQGLLLELPFYGPSDGLGPSYRYMYNRIDHKKTIVNYPSGLMYRYDPILASGLDQFEHYLNNPNREVIDLLRRAGIRYIAVSNAQIKAKFDDMGYVPLVYLDGVAIYEFDAVNEINLKSLVLCNKFTLEYDLSIDRSLPSNVGIWSKTGISSTGVAGALLLGPNTPVGAGEYTFKMYGILSSGSATIEIVSQKGNVVYQKFTLDKSMVASDGYFAIQKTVNIDRDVNDLEVRVWVGRDTITEIQGYELSKAGSSLQCQGLMFSRSLR